MLLIVAGFLLLTAACILLVSRTNGGRRVLIQVTDEDRLSMVLANAIVTSREMAGVELTAIVCGPGIVALRRNAPMSSAIDNALRQGIRIIACEDSMHRMQLGRKDMHPGLEYVLYALAEIIIRQFRGWVYIRS